MGVRACVAYTLAAPRQPGRRSGVAASLAVPVAVPEAPGTAIVGSRPEAERGVEGIRAIGSRFKDDPRRYPLLQLRQRAAGCTAARPAKFGSHAACQHCGGEKLRGEEPCECTLCWRAHDAWFRCMRMELSMSNAAIRLSVVCACGSAATPEGA